MDVMNLVERTVGRAKSARGQRVPSGLRTPPLLSGGLPLLGHAVEFVRSAIGLLSRAHRELGEVAALNVFHRRMVAVFGPEAHEAVFRAPDTLLSPSEAYKIMTPVFGKDIVYDAPPEKMAEQLKMLLPALKDRRMRAYGEAVVLETENCVSAWGQEGTVDFVEFCRVLTNFTSSRCLLGREFREGMNEEFAAVYHDLEQGVTPLAYLNAHLPIPSFIKRDRARVRLVELITRIVDARRREKRTGEDFLQTLMDAQYSNGRALSEHEITGLLLAGMFAGHHTSSVTTAWTMIELLRNPATLLRATQEVDRVFGGGKEVNHAALRELGFVENAVKEALRLHPPLFMLVRVAKQNFTYKDWFIPAGTWILISPTVSHRIPDVFANPDAFDPDRFSPPREEDKRDFAYIAFGGGRHKCLGNAFAVLQIKAILALLLGQYEFELTSDRIDSDFHGLVVGPKVPCRIRYRRRAHPSVTIASAAALAKLAGEPHASALESELRAPATASGCPVAHGPKPSQTPVSGAETAKRLKVVLDHDLCQGHAACVGEAPEAFRIGANGKVALVRDEIPTTLSDKVRAAAKFCPTHAIRIATE
jgi:sterol 14-demethylase